MASIKIAPIAEISFKYVLQTCIFILIIFLPKFAVFFVFLFLIYLNFTAPQPCEISEALYVVIFFYLTQSDDFYFSLFQLHKHTLP